MLRPIPSLLALLAAMLVTVPAIAADIDNWGDDGSDFNTDGGGLREGYATEPKDWAGLGDPTDPIHIETGLRYWYSQGSSSFTINSPIAGDHGTMTESDNTHSVEAHLRIDDNSTNTYAKAVAGIGFKIDGTADDNNGSSVITDGKMGYVGADIGYSLLGDHKTFSLSPFVGYMYWNNSPNSASQIDNYTTATSASDITFDPDTGQTTLHGYDSQPNDINAHMLRLGFSSTANLGSFFDVSAEIAGVPYAMVNGTLGAGSGFSTSGAVSYDNQSSPSFGPTGLTGATNIHNIQSSPTTIDGWGYGGMAEAMIGIHPTDNLTFRIGGRAWYLQGTADAHFSRATIGDPRDGNQPVAGDPGDPSATPPVPATPGQMNSPNFDTAPTFGNQNYITRANPFSMFRYGVLAEMTYSF